VGFQLGGQVYAEYVFFKDQTALDEFTRGNFEMGAQVSAVALTAGASRDVDYSKCAA
jgi:lipid-binding SYLF domain-containing protein